MILALNVEINPIFQYYTKDTFMVLFRNIDVEIS